MMALRLNEVMRTIRGRLARDECTSATDAALLERFRGSRDEDAFAELVRRHGGMVLGVCRRLLRNSHDAEDAFQATFLVLVRSGSAVRQLGSVASWLYGVARRTALEARRSSARRRVKEAGAMRGSAVSADSCDDLREVLDEEIEHLPEKYRAPLVLCDLEGKTRKEAARQLGWPEGTVASRLALARKSLGGRLARRGLVVPVGVLTVAAGGEAANAAVPPALVSSTVRVAAGRAVISSGVATLVKGVLTTMLLKKLKSSLVLVLAAAVLGAGGVFRGAVGTEARAADDAKARSPLEALRHENELLKLNLHVLLEKVHAQETELLAMKAQAGNTSTITLTPKYPTEAANKALVDALSLQLHAAGGKDEGGNQIRFQTLLPDKGALRIEADRSGEPLQNTLRGIVVFDDPVQRAEAALKALREARDEKSREQAVRELAATLEVLKAHHGKKP